MRFPLRARLVLACVAAVFFLSGCAAKTMAPTGPDPAKTAWEAFRAREKSPGAAWKAFRLDASLSFAAQQRSGRLNLAFYGNLDLPLRLDFTLPMGAPYAFWREDGGGWTAYYPGNQTAFTHENTREGISRLGLPLPFDLRELAAVAIGRFGELIPAAHTSVKKRPDGYEYALGPDSRLASITLDFEGKPIHLTGRGIEPWRVAFEDYQPDPEAKAPPEPKRIVLTTPGGTVVKLRIKTVEGRDQSWPESALTLPIPPGTAVRSLEAGGPVAVPDI
ncbi:hypothetical protein [Desulfolutivibrio sulfoxidireducens]|uniref:hypothetical protein n=1 Tax=Desulfolutivibrio sulfoxidireducens TaxID=2773299 RepID=UPI00159DAB6A|nr:hypothetical protein [Desulfolutivibrio sulfoxidireducens]QLA16953.1 hypothetical protein GD605_13060 [Desulfolutivibrio sulfoxidireducens]QLA20520.1 hypothetical protein GD604_12775 [Desulfolutivibrio sulfoxidireducens]